MKYRIEKIKSNTDIFTDDFHIIEIESEGIGMDGKPYKIEHTINTCETLKDAQLFLDKFTDARDVYDLNQITNYKG